METRKKPIDREDIANRSDISEYITNENLISILKEISTVFNDLDLDALWETKQNYIIGLALLFCVHYLLRRQFTRMGEDLEWRIHRNLLYNFQYHYKQFQLNIKEKNNRETMIQEFLRHKDYTQSLINMVNILGNIVSLCLVLWYFSLYITLIGSAVCYVFCLFLYTQPQLTNIQHIHNAKILISLGVYHKFINKLNNLPYWIKIELVKFCLFALYALLIYDVLHSGGYVYINNNNDSVGQDDNITKGDYYIQMCVAFSVMPFLSYKDISDVYRAISLIRYLYRNSYLITTSQRLNATTTLLMKIGETTQKIQKGLCVINGASGSGKTSLIYQFLRDNNLYANSVIVTSNFNHPLPLEDIFFLYGASTDEAYILEYINFFQFSRRLLKFPNGLKTVINGDKFKWHLCAAASSGLQILICDDINILPLLEVLRKIFPIIILTYDDKDHIYQKVANQYINLSK